MESEPKSLLAQVRDMMKAAGIDNFHIDGGALVLCGQRYRVEKCACDDPGCNGLSLCEDDIMAPGGANIVAMQ
tara:strand:+ start:70634 stop:70852 length:219 start_codon:yes stop_codon:yes gene_type:complete